MVGWPLVVMALGLLLMTGGWVFSASTDLLAVDGDAFQNLWSMTWVKDAYTAGKDIYFTQQLFYPQGVSLVGHALNPVAGGVYLVLGRWLTVIQTYNVLLILSFLISGWVMFTLAFSIKKVYLSALISGLIYTYSTSHLVQARDHLEMATVFWLPLWLLLVKKVLEGERVRVSLIGLGVVTFLSWYTSPYWVAIELVMAAGLGLFMGRSWWRGRDRLKRGLLIALVLGVALWMPLDRMRAQRIDPLVGGHDPRLFSVDLAAFFVPDQYWWQHRLTDSFWQVSLPRQYEVSAYQGFSVLFLAGLGLIAAYRKKQRLVMALGGVSLLAAWWSLGPVVRFNFYPIPIPSLYALGERFLPLVALSGVPGRVLGVVSLGVATLAFFGTIELLGKTGGKWWLLGLGAIWVVEMKPLPMPSMPVIIPRYVRVLTTMPRKGGVVDILSGPEKGLYYQTIHTQPLAWGYISRKPTSNDRWQRALLLALHQRQWESLCTEFYVAYLVVNTSFEDTATRLNRVYSDDEAQIFALECGSE
jgi:hypothetical protein